MNDTMAYDERRMATAIDLVLTDVQYAISRPELEWPPLLMAANWLPTQREREMIITAVERATGRVITVEEIPEVNRLRLTLLAEDDDQQDDDQEKAQPATDVHQ